MSYDKTTFTDDDSCPDADVDYFNKVEDGIDRAHQTADGLVAKLGAASGIATLGSDGKIPLDQIPPRARVDVFEVSSQSAMLALDAQQGDIAIRTDQNRKTYILSSDSPSTLADWKPFVFANMVTSVDGQIGDIDLTSTYAKAYDSAHTYAQFSVCFYQGVPYRSLSAENTNHQPDTSPTYWEITGGGSGTSTEAGYTFDNGQLEKTVVGYTPYRNTTPAATPEVSPGGSVPSGFTFTWNGTTPLVGAGDAILTKPASNCLGAGVYKNFTIDRGCLGNAAQIAFKYLVPTAYTSGDLALFLLDVTNGIFIPISVSAIPGSYGVPAEGYFTFVPTTSTSYRLYIHVTTSSTTAFTAEFDAFSLGAQRITQGAAISDWISYTLVLEGSGTAAYTQHSKYRRVGTNMEIDSKINITYNGSGTSPIGIILPNGFTHTHPSDFILGFYNRYDGSVVLDTDLLRSLPTNNVIGFYKTATSTPLTGADLLSGQSLWIKATVPIAQWAGSGTVGLVQGYEEYASNSDVSATASVTGSGFLQGFGNFGGFGSGWAVGTTWIRRGRFQNPIQWGRDDLELFIRQKSNNSISPAWSSSALIVKEFPAAANNYGYALRPVANDQYAFDLFLFGGGRFPSSATLGENGTPISTLASDFEWFVKKTSAGKPGETLPLVKVDARASGIQTGTSITVLFGDKRKDSHSCLNNSSGKSLFTVPITGIYLINYQLDWVGAPSSTALYVYKNNSNLVRAMATTINETYKTCALNFQEEFAAGDVLDFRAGAGVSTSINPDPQYSFLNIVLLGR